MKKHLESLTRNLDETLRKNPQLADEVERLKNDKEFVTRNREAIEYLKDTIVDQTQLEGATSYRRAVEAIILKQERPVLTILNSRAVIELNEVDSKRWKIKLEDAAKVLYEPIRAVGRIELVNHGMLDWVGTGWLLKDEIVVTNRHVAEEFARLSGNKFVFKQGSTGKIAAIIDFLEENENPAESEFEIEDVLYIQPDPGPDVAFLRVKTKGNNLPGKIVPFKGDLQQFLEIAVIGYPASDSRMPDFKLMDEIFRNIYDKKRLAPGQVTNISEGTVLHDCSTLGGCSGGALLDLTTGGVVGLHFAGRYLESNYAVPIRTVEEVFAKVTAPGFRIDATEAGAGGVNVPPYPPVQQQQKNGKPQSQPAQPAQPQRTIDVTLPINIRIEVGDIVDRYKAVLPAIISDTDDIADEAFVEGRVEDYRDREGYVVGFLDEEVPLPKVVDEELAEQILFFGDNDEESVLKYTHFSVLMNKKRRLCFYSAVNIDGKFSISMRRGPWRFDPRIPKELQIMKECYGNSPKFSRGHMTRREDPIWGRGKAPSKGNEDSMHVTNVTPQLQSMNGGVWLELENYALRNARKDKMRISVFTGPVFAKSDKPEHGVRIPVEFWKIVAFIHDETGELCATGYMISQEEDMANRDREFIFGPHDMDQVAITTIEAKTGLSFGKLTKLDPLFSENEGVETAARPLYTPDDIVFFKKEKAL